MLNEMMSLISVFWVIFSFSFLVALTGAMSPGPLLTYTIIKSAETNTRGYLMGIWIIIGHAILESALIVVLLLGFSYVLQNIIIIRTIGIAGGMILILFGLSIIRDVYLKKVSTGFLNPDNTRDKTPGPSRNKSLNNPIVGGILVSMSNPYWWIWWAAIGSAFMIQFDISFSNWPRLLAFFLGHEAGDMAWYLFVSVLAFFGLRHLNRKTYYGILAGCGIFMILFGIYLGVSPFFNGNS